MRNPGVQTGRIALLRFATLRMPPAAGSTPDRRRMQRDYPAKQDLD
jgi:hypothetical protein